MNPQLTSPTEKQPDEDLGAAISALRHRLTWLEPLLQNKGFKTFMEECILARGGILQQEALNVSIGDKDSRDLAAQKAALIAELYRWPEVSMRNCRARIEEMEAQRKREKAGEHATPHGF